MGGRRGLLQGPQKRSSSSLYLRDQSVISSVEKDAAERKKHSSSSLISLRVNNNVISNLSLESSTKKSIPERGSLKKNFVEPKNDNQLPSISFIERCAYDVLKQHVYLLLDHVSQNQLACSNKFFSAMLKNTASSSKITCTYQAPQAWWQKLLNNPVLKQVKELNNYHAAYLLLKLMITYQIPADSLLNRIDMPRPAYMSFRYHDASGVEKVIRDESPVRLLAYAMLKLNPELLTMKTEVLNPSGVNSKRIYTSVLEYLCSSGDRIMLDLISQHIDSGAEKIKSQLNKLYTLALMPVIPRQQDVNEAIDTMRYTHVILLPESETLPLDREDDVLLLQKIGNQVALIRQQGTVLKQEKIIDDYRVIKNAWFSTSNDPESFCPFDKIRVLSVEHDLPLIKELVSVCNYPLPLPLQTCLIKYFNNKDEAEFMLYAKSLNGEYQKIKISSSEKDCFIHLNYKFPPSDMRHAVLISGDEVINHCRNNNVDALKMLLHPTTLLLRNFVRGIEELVTKYHNIFIPNERLSEFYSDARVLVREPQLCMPSWLILGLYFSERSLHHIPTDFYGRFLSVSLQAWGGVYLSENLNGGKRWDAMGSRHHNFFKGLDLRYSDGQGREAMYADFVVTGSEESRWAINRGMPYLGADYGVTRDARAIKTLGPMIVRS